MGWHDHRGHKAAEVKPKANELSKELLSACALNPFENTGDGSRSQMFIKPAVVDSEKFGSVFAENISMEEARIQEKNEALVQEFLAKNEAELPEIVHSRRVAVSGDYVDNGVRKMYLLEHMRYNIFWRFGQALFINGQCVYEGTLSHEKCIEIELELARLQISISETPLPYR